MIRSLLKRTKFHRAALMLLAMLLTTTSAWAETETVTYIKADGTSSTQEATILKRAAILLPPLQQQLLLTI